MKLMKSSSRKEIRNLINLNGENGWKYSSLIDELVKSFMIKMELIVHQC